MPPKNMTSVMRKTHIPRVEASFCCSAVSNCSRRASVSTWASANFDHLPHYGAVIVGFVGHHRDLVEVVNRRRRGRLPLKTGSAPWVRSGDLPEPQGPDEINHGNDVAHGQHG